MLHSIFCGVRVQRGINTFLINSHVVNRNAFDDKLVKGLF